MTGDGRRVAVVLHEEALGGASRAVLRVTPALEELGWSLSFWVPPGPCAEELRRQGRPVAGEPRLIRYSLASLRTPPGAMRRLSSIPGYLHSLRRWLSDERPALVHANTLLTIPEASRAHAAGLPTALHVHEMLSPGPKGRAAARLLRHSTDMVMAPPAPAAQALRDAGVTVREIGLGTPLATLQRPQRTKGAPPVIGTVGVVSRRKGSDTFIAAAASIREQFPDADLRMIGPPADGPEHDWAAALIAKAEAAGVRCGPSSDTYKELSEWDVFVLPSREDPFPLAILEAMAVGVAVVGTRAGGIPQQIGDGAGVLVEPDDAGALAEAIAALIREPARREALEATARRRVEERFTLERQAEAMDAAYNDMLERHAAQRAGRTSTAA